MTVSSKGMISDIWTTLQLAGRKTIEATDHDGNESICSHVREQNARDLQSTLEREHSSHCRIGVEP